jgi:hypothetical protein
MPRREGLPDGPCPQKVNNRSVKLCQGDLYTVHTDGRSDGPSVGGSYRANTFCPVRLCVREIQHFRFLGHKVGPDAGPDIIFTCEHSLSGPTLCPTYSCQSNQDSMQPPGIHILLIYKRTDVS